MVLRQNWLEKSNLKDIDQWKCMNYHHKIPGLNYYMRVFTIEEGGFFGTFRKRMAFEHRIL